MTNKIATCFDSMEKCINKSDNLVKNKDGTYVDAHGWSEVVGAKADDHRLTIRLWRPTSFEEVLTLHLST